MFGYVVPDKQRFTPEEFTLYRAFYCGICLTLKEEYGELPRLFTTYDITFLSILSHDCLKYAVQFKNARCIASLKKHGFVCSSPLMRKLAAISVLLSCYKLKDDIIDGKTSRRIAFAAYKKAFAKAGEVCPEADEIINRRYGQLCEMEKQNEAVVDKVCDSFGCMLRELVGMIVENADDNLLSLAYNIGKYVYLLDAIDDYDDDRKKKNYNPFLASYGEYENRKAFLSKNGAEVEFIVSSTINRAIAAFNDRLYYQSYPVLKNILHYGLRKRAQQVFDGEKPKRI